MKKKITIEDVQREKEKDIGNSVIDRNAKSVRNNRILESKGLNFKGIAFIYRCFDDYINFPTFSEWIEGKSKYTDKELIILDKLLWVSEYPSQALNNIKSALDFLSTLKNNTYSLEGFDNYLIENNLLKKEVFKDDNC